MQPPDLRQGQVPELKATSPSNPKAEIAGAAPVMGTPTIIKGLNVAIKIRVIPAPTADQPESPPAAIQEVTVQPQSQPSECSSFCHPEEPCMITESGVCDVKIEANPFMAALSGAVEPPPWEVDEAYTIIEAMKEHYDRSRKGEALFLRNRLSGELFKVISYNPEDGRAVLESPEKAKLKPVITQREVPLYSPFWRS